MRDLCNSIRRKQITQFKAEQNIKQILHQKQYMDGKKAHGKLLNIISNYRNANLNKNKAPPFRKATGKKQNMEPSYIADESANCTATLENGVAFS